MGFSLATLNKWSKAMADKGGMALIDMRGRHSPSSMTTNGRGVVEETFHNAILEYGKCDACYPDNGTQYT